MQSCISAEVDGRADGEEVRKVSGEHENVRKKKQIVQTPKLLQRIQMVKRVRWVQMNNS
jgi:hypothetical protein